MVGLLATIPGFTMIVQSSYGLLDAMLIRVNELSAIQRPSKNDWRIVASWIAEQQPLVQDEQSFIEGKDDLVMLHRRRERAGLEHVVAQALDQTDNALTQCGWESNIIRVGSPLTRSFRADGGEIEIVRAQGAAEAIQRAGSQVLEPLSDVRYGRPDHHCHHIRPLSVARGGYV